MKPGPSFSGHPYPERREYDLMILKSSTFVWFVSFFGINYSVLTGVKPPNRPSIHSEKLIRMLKNSFLSFLSLPSAL